MSILKTEALVINKHDFRETSIITNLYTRDFGKISGILKGIREDPEKFASTLENFSLNEIIFYKKREPGVHLVSQCDIKDNFSGIRQNIMKAGCANIMMELINSLMMPEEKNEDVFNLAASCLKEIEMGNNAEKITSIFKIKMLDFSGFKPHLDSCVNCKDKIFGQSKFSLMLGGLLCEKCFSKDTSSRPIYRGTVATIMHIEKNELKNSLNLGMNPQIKKELELILNAFLNFHLEKELKSQKVLNKLSVAL